MATTSDLTTGNLPSAATGIAQILVNASTIFDTCYRGLNMLESESNPQPVSSQIIFTAPDGVDYLLIRHTIPLSPTWRTDSGKLWARVNPRSIVTIPSALLSN